MLFRFGTVSLLARMVPAFVAGDAIGASLVRRGARGGARGGWGGDNFCSPVAKTGLLRMTPKVMRLMMA